MEIIGFCIYAAFFCQHTILELCIFFHIACTKQKFIVTVDYHNYEKECMGYFLF